MLSEAYPCLRGARLPPGFLPAFRGWIAIGALYGQRWLFEIAAGLAVVTGASAVVGLALGCMRMVRETRLAVQSLAAEAEIRLRPANSNAVRS